MFVGIIVYTYYLLRLNRSLIYYNSNFNHNRFFFLLDGEQQFLDLDDKLNRYAKYAPNLWKDDVSDL